MAQVNIDLPIFFHTDETAQLSELNLKYKLRDCETREMFFLDVSAIAPYKEENGEHEYTKLFVGDNFFICKMSYDTLRDKLIQNSNIYNGKATPNQG